MKLKRKQKQLIIIGFILIILTPAIVLIGTPVLFESLCSSGTTGSCSPLPSLYVWMPFLFGPLLAGVILILIAFLSKK